MCEMIYNKMILWIINITCYITSLFHVISCMFVLTYEYAPLNYNCNLRKSRHFLCKLGNMYFLCICGQHALEFDHEYHKIVRISALYYPLPLNQYVCFPPYKYNVILFEFIFLYNSDLFYIIILLLIYPANEYKKLDIYISNVY